MWTLALDCAVRACKDGINRQMLNFTFPMLRDGAPMGPPLPSNSISSPRAPLVSTRRLLQVTWLGNFEWRRSSWKLC